MVRSVLGSPLLHSLLILGIMTVNPAFSEVSLPSLFGDGMVFQASREMNIWGEATPNEWVSISMGEHFAQTVAREDGSWEAVLPPMPIGGPHELIVSGSNEVRFADVLVGEVWVCAGQSNMEFPLRSTDRASVELVGSDLPQIRLFKVGRSISTEPRDDLEGRWEVCSPESAASFSAVAYHFGKEIHQSQGVPVGLILTCWGGTPAEAWTPEPALRKIPAQRRYLNRWRESRWGFALNPYGTKPPPENWEPAALFNGMVAPLTPFSIRGAIWYQGESNAARAYEYRDLFRGTIEGWRKEWGEGELPFLFVQLPKWGPRNNQPGESDWAELREAQSMALELRHTEMAVTIDLGNAEDIHPPKKKEFGHRLALLARESVYGEDISARSPRFASMEIVDSTARIFFKDTGKGLIASGWGSLTGFEVAGPDRVFHRADARIEDKSVCVHCDRVPTPVAVRYAWDHNPETNLVGGNGLPVAPFRTDDWPGRTEARFANLVRSLKGKVIRRFGN